MMLEVYELIWRLFIIIEKEVGFTVLYICLPEAALTNKV